MEIDWQFYHFHLEPSAVCALKCPRCPRTEHPDTPWLNYQMDLNFVKQFLTEDILKTKVQRITMCGDVGDPIYCRDYLKIYRYIKETNPNIHIVTVTNGSNRSTSWWKEFSQIANENDVVNFSIDGHDNKSNNMYRVNSSWDSIINGIKTLRENNKTVFITWAMIVFRFNQNYLAKMEATAKDLGMDFLQITKSTKFGSKYGDAYNGKMDPLEPSEEFISDTERYQRKTINLSGRKFNNKKYIKTNQNRYEIVKEKYKNSDIIPLCEVGNRGLYVNAEGVVFPCSWVSFPYTSLSDGTKTIKWEDSFFAKYRERMNIKNRTFDEILTDPLWKLCSRGWTDSSKTWVECSTKCSKKYVDNDYAVGWETN